MIYTLADGIKFRLTVPVEQTKSSVRDFKTYIQKQKEIPAECQTLFMCHDGAQFKCLKDGEKIPELRQGQRTTTLHLYVRKTAQLPELEKTRKSDYDEWFKKFQELKLSPYYKGE